MTEVNHFEDEVPLEKKLLAWGVHLFTASGAFCGFLAIIAIIQHDWFMAFMWMGATAVIDSLDGTLARRFRVKGMLPGFDGALLDNIIDYQTYVIIPALFLYQANLLPAAWALIGAALVVITSAYQFCQEDAKTEDNFFKGFPSYWNVVVYYLFMLQAGEWANFAVIALCSLLVFVPIKYLYPSKMERYQRETLVLTGIWGIMLIVPLVMYPNYPLWLVWASLYFIVYYVGLSLYLMMQRN